MVLVAGLAASCSAESKPNSAGDPRSPDASTVLFADVTESAGLGSFRHHNGAVGNKWYPEMMGSGGGFIDYNNDGWLDILLLGGGMWEEDPAVTPRALWLYENNGDGTFVDVTEKAGLADVEAYTIGFAAADYDNDGREDFVLTNLGPDMLFRNTGGVFLDVSQAAGIASFEEWGSSPLFFDADRDGHLDLFISNYVEWSPATDKWCPDGSRIKMYCNPADYEGIASRFYRSNGDGTFTERTQEAGFLTGAQAVRDKALGVVEIDYNEDSWPDLYVVTDGEGNLLYENQGDGTFVERSILSGVAFSEHGEARAGMGVDAGVVDSSGSVSLFVGNFSEEPISVYRHEGGGLFLDRSSASRLHQPSFLTLTFGLILFDADLDGDLDLLAANGHVHPDRVGIQDNITFEQPAQLYLNRGDGTFAEVKQREGVLARRMVGRAAAYGDFDRDGQLDVLLTENGGGAHLWRNDAGRGQFLRVRLQGHESNRDALGSRVVAVVGTHRMERRIRTGSSYLSQSEKVAAFGLGSAGYVDSLIVHWPGGRVHRFGRVEGGQEVKIMENSDALERMSMETIREDILAGQ